MIIIIIIMVDFAIPADHRVKIKENKERDKYLDLARELRKLWNMKVTVILVVIGAFGMIFKGLERGLEQLEIRGRGGNIQITAILRSARILILSFIGYQMNFWTLKKESHLWHVGAFHCAKIGKSILWIIIVLMAYAWACGFNLVLLQGLY